MIKKFATIASSTLFAIFLDLLASIILARALLPNGVGQVALIASLSVMYVAFSNLGLGQSYIYLLNSKNRLEKDVVQNSIITAVVGGIFAIICIYYILTIFSDYFGDYPTYCNLLIATGIASSLAQSFFRPILIAKLKVKNIATLTVGLSLITTGSFVFLYYYNENLITVELALSIQSVSKVIIMIFMFLLVGKGFFSDFKLSINLFRESITEGAKFYFSFLISQANVHVAVLMMQVYLTDFTQVGLYSRAVSLTLFMTAVPFSLGPLLFSRWAKTGVKIAAVETLTTLKIFSITLLLICPILIGYREELLVLIYGEPFRLSGDIFAILAVGTCLKILADPIINYLSSIGLVHLNGYASLVGVIIFILTAMYFIPIYGAVGAAVSFAVSNLVIFLFLLFISLPHGLDFKGGYYFTRKELNFIFEVFKR